MYEISKTVVHEISETTRQLTTHFLFSLEARCAFPTFNCADRNPCESTLCEQDVNNYPGPGPKTYVSCEGGCSEEKCPRRQVWDQDAQRCVRKNRL